MIDTDNFIYLLYSQVKHMAENTMRKRGRPRDPAVIENITELGGQALLDLGFERASMEQIAARAGVSKMTLYNYFPNKTALLEHCVRHKTDSHFEGFDESKYDPANPAKGLRTLASQFLRLMRDPEVVRMMGMMHGMAGHHPEVCQSYFLAGPALVMHRINSYLEKAKACNSLNIEDTGMAANLFLGMLMGPSHVIAILGLGIASAKEDAKLIEEAVDTFLLRFKA
ncbi:TetR/AcrR family transcriptional regulator C-terminal domain-containing protein [Limnobacter sp.]|uniref:TetR/AcrR family transcriptional regulator n=1 Tax=Limnobacter sp. TaxID=2003368 RepID=UPI00102D6C07|nr:TetR/AcrR family transcriptional regulator C-terminal domain-containing protein [Limnobacter sp.]